MLSSKDLDLFTSPRNPEVSLVRLVVGIGNAVAVAAENRLGELGRLAEGGLAEETGGRRPAEAEELAGCDDGGGDDGQGYNE